MSDKTISVRLTPKAARNEIKGWVANADGQPFLKVSVTTVPEKGKANAALIALLSKSWKIPKRNITIIHGEIARTKTLLIKDFPEGLLS